MRKSRICIQRERWRGVAKPDMRELEAELGYRFGQGLWLAEAMTHPSYRAEHGRVERDNQRLEFLGDAVLQLIATDFLFRRYPDLEEGPLTRLRSLITSEPALARFAAHLGLGRFLLLGKGERHSGGEERASNLADAFEALLGALYLDGGLPAATAVLDRAVTAIMPDPLQALAAENPKGRLQELTQERQGAAPVYEVLAVTGPEHEPQFEVAVKLEGETVAVARAGNRRLAEKEAARLALERLAAAAAGGESG
jgi:ribonuclease-3